MDKRRKKARIFSALEVANICGVVNQTAINWIKGTHLKAFTTPGGQYRVYADDLYKFLMKRGMNVPDELIEHVTIASNRKILIVDDDLELSNILKGLIKSSIDDIEVQQAFDGFEAGQLIYQMLPSLVILDIDLPGVDGHQLCRKIRTDEKLGQPIIISVSGMHESEGEKMIAEGADAFFQKPLEFEKFLDRIKSEFKS